MRLSSRLGLTLLAVLPSATVAVHAGAVGPRTFTLDTLDRLSGGDLKGVSVVADGTVRAGWTLGNVPLPDASASFSTLALADGSVLVGTSPNGKIFKLTGDQATVFADTKELAVSSMVQDKAGTIYAATIPSGKIYKVSQGKAEVFVTLPEAEHVWALVLDKAKSTLFAATGPHGKIFRIEPSGQHSVYFKSEEPHIVSLAMTDGGDLLAGSSGGALLFRISGPQRATVMHDFAGEEVKAIAVGPRGETWVVANEYGSIPEPPRRSPAMGRMPAPSSSPARMRPGKGRLWRFDPTGRPEQMMAHNDFHYLSLTLGAGGEPYVGAGDEGRVYTVSDAHLVTLVADAEERQIAGIVFAGGKTYVAASDPAVFHRVVSVGGADSVWTSKVLDAGLRARFGHLGWRASGGLDVSTRSGNTGTPDATWSPWSGALAPGAQIPSPPGRYVQVRARWRDAKAVLEEVTLPFITDNLRPVVTEVTASQRGSARDGKEGLTASGTEVGKHDTVVRISWRVDNQDSDALRYRVSYKREGQTLWRDLLKADEILTKTDYDWDTLALPEGKYRIRVEASDEAANPPELVLKHALESQPVLVDNTAPELKLAIQARELKGTVKDGLGPIQRIELAVDGRLEWRPLAPVDGLLDSPEESLQVNLARILSPGPHLVAVRVFDSAGNSAIQELEVP